MGGRTRDQMVGGNIMPPLRRLQVSLVVPQGLGSTLAASLLKIAIRDR